MTRPKKPVKHGQILFTAGPAMPFLGQPAWSHTSKHFRGVVKTGISQMLRDAFGATNAERTFHFDGGATSLQEAVLRQLHWPDRSGRSLGVLTNGGFGKRWATYAQQLKLPCVELAADFGTPIPAARFADFLDKHQEVTTVYAVAADTSVGIGNPVDQYARVLREKRGDQGLLVVDCVLEIGGRPFLFDEWGIGVAVSSAGKCLGGPTNIGLCAISKAADARMQEVGEDTGSPTLGLVRWWNMMRDSMFHHTDGVDQGIALYETLRRVLGYGGITPGPAGLEALRKQLSRLNAAMLAGFEAMGMFEMGFGYFIQDPASRLPQLTVLTLPPWLQGDPDQEFRDSLETGYDIYLGGGLGALKGKIWRIGTMGAVDLPQVVYLLKVLDGLFDGKPGHRKGKAADAATASYGE